MYEKLLKSIQKPALWQRCSQPFWDDEHISKGMLAAHLDAGLDAASRKLDTIERSVKWIASLLPEDGRILDLGCGPGLYCSRFSQLGFSVTGVDLSRRSINYAAKNDKVSKYVLGNYLKADYSNAYDAVTLIYCDYAALTPPERRVLLSKVRGALGEGGAFIFDVFTDASRAGKTETREWTECPNGGFWSPEPHLLLEANYYYEGGEVEASQSVVVTRDDVKEYIIWDTVFDEKRLARELSEGGLRLDAVYADVCGSPYDPDSRTLCAVARRA